jgi:hypothetical protein
MKTIKAIIIDPIVRFVSYCEVEVNNDSAYEGLRDLVFRHRDQPGYLDVVRVGAGHSLFVDDEGIMSDWDSQGFFYLGDAQGNGQTLAGVAILVRDTPDGDSADCTLPIELVESKVTWLHPKEVRVPAPFMTTWDDNNKEKKTLLHGVEFWTYDNQPSKE